MICPDLQVSLELLGGIFERIVICAARHQIRLDLSDRGGVPGLSSDPWLCSASTVVPLAMSACINDILVDRQWITWQE